MSLQGRSSQRVARSIAAASSGRRWRATHGFHDLISLREIRKRRQRRARNAVVGRCEAVEGRGPRC
jgi:hypothetical protein